MFEVKTMNNIARQGLDALAAGIMRETDAPRPFVAIDGNYALFDFTLSFTKPDRKRSALHAERREVRLRAYFVAEIYGFRDIDGGNGRIGTVRYRAYEHGRYSCACAGETARRRGDLSFARITPVSEKHGARKFVARHFFENFFKSLRKIGKRRTERPRVHIVAARKSLLDNASEIRRREEARARGRCVR